MYVSWLLVDFVASVGPLADVGGGRGEALASLACLPLLKAGFDLGDLIWVIWASIPCQQERVICRLADFRTEGMYSPCLRQENQKSKL